MDTSELRATLESAGLSPYEAEAYVSLLDLGAGSVRELVAASDVPEPRIYDVVRSLAERGYVETYQQDVLRARVHSPAEVLEDLQARANRLESAAEEIESRWEQPELDSHAASIVKRFQTVVDRARMFIEEAETQIQLSASREEFEELRPYLRAAHDRGVHVQVSLYTYPDEADGLPPQEALEGACTEARHRPIPSPFVCLVDRRRVCFAPHEDALNEYGLLVDDKLYEYVIHWYFLSCLWDICDPVYSVRNDEPPIEYVDVREFIRQVEPLVRDGAVVTVDIEGVDTDTGDERTVSGEIVDIYYQGQGSDVQGQTRLPQLAGRASVTVSTEDGEVIVGGEGAMLEDVEAQQITATEIAES